MLEVAGKWWCRTFHKKVMRPVCGHYRCAECLREWPVNWGLDLPATSAASGPDIIPARAHVLA